MKITKFHNPLLYLVIISLSIALSPFLGSDQRNYWLITLMIVLPTVNVCLGFSLSKKEFILVLYMFSILIFQCLFNFDSLRLSTILYSYMFIVTAIIYFYYLEVHGIRAYEYSKILKVIILSYALVLILQQLCVILGLPIINVSLYDSASPWKLNSLSAEPSHSARIITLVMYSYIVVKDSIDNCRHNIMSSIHGDKLLWGAYLWLVFTMGSGTAILFFLLLMFRFITLRSITILITSLLVAFYFLYKEDVSIVVRVVDTIAATFTFNPEIIMQVDHSASIRIVPSIILLNKIELFTIIGMFGNGVDFVSTFLSSEMIGVPDGFSSGGSLLIWMEYGFISFFLFYLYAFKRTVDLKEPVTLLFYFFVILLYGVNNQIVWLTIILLGTNKFIDRVSNNA